MTEDSRIEFKSKLTDDLEKEVVAFLNAEGGIIYIGRAENRAYKLNNIDEEIINLVSHENAKKLFNLPI